MNNSKNTSLQFTELTPDDIAIQEDLYIDLLLVSNFSVPPGYCGQLYGQLYYDHAIIELQKANKLFLKAFS